MSTVITTTTKACEVASSVLLASTQQLNNVIKRINPFDANFRQANKVLAK